MIRLDPYPDGFSYGDYFPEHKDRIPERFLAEGVYRFAAGIDDHAAGIAAFYQEEKNVFLALWYQDGVKADEAAGVLGFITERIIRLYHPERITACERSGFLHKVYEACGYYPKGENYQKLIEPWRLLLDDSVFDENGLIINQGKMDKIPFGWFDTKAKGCGWIAAYNLLKMNGMEKSMRYCASGLEKRAILGEAMGQEVYTEWFWLRKQGLKAYKSIPSNRMALAAIRQSETGIILYNHTHGAHYVAYRNLHDGTIHVYNAVYGKRDHIIDPGEFLKKYSLFPVCTVIYVKKENRL